MIKEFGFKRPDLICWTEFASKCAHISTAHLFRPPLDKTKANSCTYRLHRVGGCFPLRCYGQKWPRNWPLSCRLAAEVSSQFLWCGSSYSICTTVWLRSRSAHGLTVTRALDKLENLPFLIIWQGWWVFGGWGGGFTPSLHGKPLDVYPLQLISHSQQIRHIRCCFGRGHQSG